MYAFFFLSCEGCILIWEDFTTRKKKYPKSLIIKSIYSWSSARAFESGLWVKVAILMQMEGIKLSFLRRNLIKRVQHFREVFFSGKTYLV